MSSSVPGMTELGTDWRMLDGVATAWFDASSLIDAAALAGRIVELSPASVLDLRATGVRARLDSEVHADAVSALARDRGLTANPAVLQQVSVAFDSTNPSKISRFWQRALDYAPGEDGLTDPLRRDPALRIRRSNEPRPLRNRVHLDVVDGDDGGVADPLRRDPALRMRQSADARPLRNRIHLDVVRPAAAVQQADLGEASGPYGVCHADPDGNEVDLVPGDVLGHSVATADWQAVFSAMACYRVTSPAQQGDLAAAAAALAGDAGFPLLIDLRPGLVILDSGKDQWESDTHGLEVDFTDLAGSLQAAARELGASADVELPRFVQLFLDAADVATVRAFWVAALGYVEDRRAGVSDIHDSRRLNPVLVFQELDESQTQRRRQRNRIHVELAVPSDLVQARLATTLAAGGRLLEQSERRWRVADPEGNEIVIVSGA